MKRIFTFILLFVFVSVTTFAQNFEKQNVDRNGNPTFVKFDAKAQSFSKSETKAVLSGLFNMTSNDEYKTIRSEKDQIGFTHERFQQYCKGIKVEHGVYVVHSSNGVIESMSGEYKKVNDIKVTPSISSAKAFENAKAFINAKEYMQEKNTAPELVIVADSYGKKLDDVYEMVLAYKVDVYATKPLSRDNVYVNAHTGEIVNVNATLLTAAETGSADTRYSGTKSIATDSYNGSYRLRDYTRGNGIETYNCNEGTSYTSAVDFTDSDNNWTAAEYDNVDKDNGALDAHWAGLVTYDYFNNTHNRNSFDGNGAAVKAYVHFDSNYDNAYWNGSVLTFGDGSSFDILTSLDVYGHEFGHAVCSYTANLAYQNESGALNEAFSDIWGCVVEYYNAPEKDTWAMGEDLGSALRSLSDPKSKGLPDTYMGENWYPLASSPSRFNDYGGVHYNNGPFCHMFYLLSEGGSGTNDNSDSYSISAIGIDKAELIAYRVESVYMTSSSDYADARTYVIQAAVDLYGAGSNEEIQVTNAMYAVGVGDAYAGGSSDTEAPTTPANLSSSNVTGSSVDLSWNASSDNIGVTGYDVFKDGAYHATTASTNYTVTGLSGSTSYSFYVKAKDAAGNLSAASNTVNVTTDVLTVDPMISTINISAAPSGNRYYVTSTINVTSGGNPVGNAYVEFTWSGSYSGTVSGYTDASGNFASTSAKIKLSSITVTTNAITATGYYWDMAASEVADSYTSFAFATMIETSTYPNPCYSELNFVIEQDNASNATIHIFDITGKEVIMKQVEINQGFNQIQLNVENLEGGIYFYRVSTDEGLSSGKIIKK